MSDEHEAFGENGEGRVYVPSSSNENAGHSPKVVVAFFWFGSSEEECGRMKMEIDYAQHQPISTRMALES